MENFKEVINNLFASKGSFIGLIISFIKGIYQIRKKDFKVLVFICDLVLSIIIGYVCRELTLPLDIQEIYKVIFTGVMSGNSFVIFAILFNPDFFTKVFVGVVERSTGIELKNKSGKK